jgi:hypothetical protein
MSAQHDYWRECLSIAAEECDLELLPEQLNCLANSVEAGHENYSMAFYSPPPSDRLKEIENVWKKKLIVLQAEFDAYRGYAEVAVKRALHVHQDDDISIEPHGEVLRLGGRTERIQ